ncbi:hypothetical protein ABK046_41905 [Streptomyces caeruleatus]|nr:hypothetical protein [Streptomyces sp. RP5T]
MVEKCFARAREQHRTDMAEARHGALQLGGGRLRVGCGQCGEGRETVGVTVRGVREHIVGLPGERDGHFRGQGLGTGGGDGEDLHVHTTGVHARQTLLADIEQTEIDLPLTAHLVDGLIATPLEQGST